MTCSQGRIGGLIVREGAHRYEASARGAHVDVLQGVGVLLIARVDFKHHVILVQLRVDGRDLALAEGVIQGLVDRLGGDAQARSRVTLDGQVGFEAAVLLVRRDVAQLRQSLQPSHQPRRPLIEVLQVVSLQGVLVLRARWPAAHPDVLHGLHEKRRPSDARRLASNPPDHLIGADLPLPQRFELREHPRRVDRPAASRKRHHVVNRGIGLDDVDILPQLLRRGLEGDVLGGLDGADQPASVLLGKEPLGNGDVERDVDAHSGDGQRQRQAFVAQHPGKVDFVEMMQRVEPARA